MKGFECMEKKYEPLDLELPANKKKWNVPLIIVSIVWILLSLLSPFAVMSLAVCIIYICVPAAIIIYSIIKRKANKIALIIICNLISVIFNSFILFTHLSTSMITETTL